MNVVLINVDIGDLDVLDRGGFGDVCARGDHLHVRRKMKVVCIEDSPGAIIPARASFVAGERLLQQEGDNKRLEQPRRSIYEVGKRRE